MKIYKMQAKGSHGEIYLYDVIGEGWFGGISAAQFAKDLKALGNVKTIDVRINSEGGDVFDGRTIYTLLKQHSAKVTVYIDGLAASIASVIALAGDEIVMAEGSFMMIHNAWSGCYGDAREMRRVADLLDTVTQSIAETYCKKTGCDEKKIKEMMDAETWMTASECIKLGFADREADGMRAAACVHNDKIKFRRVPAALLPRPALNAAKAKLAAMVQR